MSTTSIGRFAEDYAAFYLKSVGYKISSQNWRTRQCEIDIVAKKQKTIYFVEVKYRKTVDYGGGLEYITPAKQKQMLFAAKMWCSQNNWTGDYRLSAIEVTGEKFKITEFIEDIS